VAQDMRISCSAVVAVCWGQRQALTKRVLLVHLISQHCQDSQAGANHKGPRSDLGAACCQ
jgi:hypothetical protein